MASRLMKNPWTGYVRNEIGQRSRDQPPKRAFGNIFQEKWFWVMPQISHSRHCLFNLICLCFSVMLMRQPWQRCSTSHRVTWQWSLPPAYSGVPPSCRLESGRGRISWHNGYKRKFDDYDVVMKEFWKVFRSKKILRLILKVRMAKQNKPLKKGLILLILVNFGIGLNIIFGMNKWVNFVERHGQSIHWEAKFENNICEG